MTRHGKNATASAVYSYSERHKDAKQSGYGTLHERLGADSFKGFDCCSISLQPCREPLITKDGYIYDKESVLEYIVKQKKEAAKKLKEWERQKQRGMIEMEELARAETETKAKKFALLEGTPAHPGIAADEMNSPGLSGNVSNMSGLKSKQLPSFWIPELNPSASKSKLDKPSQKILCPLSGKTLKMKDLMPVTFVPIKDGDTVTKSVAKKIRYMCAVTHDALTNTMRLAYLKTSGNVVTMSCVEKIIRKDMIDPTNGKEMSESDIIELNRGGTGFASTNDVKAKLARPQLELQ